MSNFNPRDLRNAFGSFMTGVTVVTTIADDGSPRGFTANSFTSVSIDPALLLICVGKQVGSLTSFTEGAKFAVNVLSEDQTDISNTFAAPTDDRFAMVKWHTGPNGSPILDGVAAWFDCSRHTSIDAGDHVIIIGEVRAFDDSLRNGLGFIRGNYFTAATEHEALRAALHSARDHSYMVLGAIVENDNRILLIETEDGQLSVPSVGESASSGSIKRLTDFLVSIGVHSELGSIYAVYEHRDEARHSLYYHVIEAHDSSTRGHYYPLNQLPLERIREAAMRSMLERFATEHAQGRFRVYIGDDKRGDVIERGS